MNFSFFTVFLKNRNISSNIKRSKVTDYAALTKGLIMMRLDQHTLNRASYKGPTLELMGPTLLLMFNSD